MEGIRKVIAFKRFYEIQTLRLMFNIGGKNEQKLRDWFTNYGDETLEAIKESELAYLVEEL